MLDDTLDFTANLGSARRFVMAPPRNLRTCSCLRGVERGLFCKNEVGGGSDRCDRPCIGGSSASNDTKTKPSAD